MLMILTDERTGRIVGAGTTANSLAKSYAAMAHEPLHKPPPRPLLVIRKPKLAPRQVLAKAHPTTRNPSPFDQLSRDLREVQLRRRINGR